MSQFLYDFIEAFSFWNSSFFKEHFWTHFFQNIFLSDSVLLKHLPHFIFRSYLSIYFWNSTLLLKDFSRHFQFSFVDTSFLFPHFWENFFDDWKNFLKTLQEYSFCLNFLTSMYQTLKFHSIQNIYENVDSSVKNAIFMVNDDMERTNFNRFHLFLLKRN